MQNRNPKPFLVFLPLQPGQSFPTPAGVIHAYSKRQAQTLAPAGASVFPVRKGGPLHADIYRA